MNADISPRGRRWFRKRILAAGTIFVALIAGWWIWSRPTRVPLSDGRTLAIDKVSVGPIFVAYEPFSFRLLWRVLSNRPMIWPNFGFPAQDGGIGILYHTEPVQGPVADEMYFTDRDGWWWKTTQGASLSWGQQLAAFSRIDWPSPLRFEVWREGTRLGAGQLNFTPPVLEVTERTPVPFPVRQDTGPVSIVLKGLEVETRDDLRPSQAEGRLIVETFRDGRPSRMRLSRFMLLHRLGRGNQPPMDEEGRFTTTISPHGPYWYVTFLAWRDIFDPLDPDAMFVFDPFRDGQGATRPQQTPGAPGPVWYDRDVGGVGWRFTIVPPDGAGTCRRRYPGGEYSVTTGNQPLLICEKEPQKTAALRVEFRRPDGNLLYHGLADQQPGDDAHPLEVLCPKLDPAQPYEIHIGVHIPVRFEAVIRPTVLGPAKSPPRPEPEPRRLNGTPG